MQERRLERGKDNLVRLFGIAQQQIKGLLVVLQGKAMGDHGSHIDRARANQRVRLAKVSSGRPVAETAPALEQAMATVASP